MIIIRKGAVLDDKQRTVIGRIDDYTNGKTLEVTRGHSTPVEQLHTIAALAKQHGVKFREFNPEDLDIYCTFTMGGKQLYCWQQTWSRLLAIGVIVNPPLVAACLELYKGEIGKIIQPSPHITSDPIDFSGGSNIQEVYDILNAAKNGGVGIRKLLLESKNNCVHVDLEKEIPNG